MDVGDLPDFNPEQEAWAAEASHSNPQPVLCADCPASQRQPATSYCRQCSTYYCDECWADRRPHRRGDPGHERIQIEGSQTEDLTPVLYASGPPYP